MKNEPLVSIIIPTKNSASTIEACLKSIKNQTYKNIEVILVDGYSKDSTRKIANEFSATILSFQPNVKEGYFDAPFRRNYGASKSKGKYIYYLDADMELTIELIKDAVELCENQYDALIIPEESFGVGIWAQAKKLERQCYLGDENVEAPRFFKKDVWDKLGGLDENLGGGGDDWDMFQKLKDKNYKVGRTKNIIYHNEGNLQINKLIKKRFMYGCDALKYLKKRPKQAGLSYFPFRLGYFKKWHLFMSQPITTIFFIIMRSSEYLAGLTGVIYSLIFNKNE